MFLRTQTTAGRTCLLLVENERVDGRIKQRVLHRLGRLDQLQACGQLDRLLASLGRFATKLAVLGAHDRGESVTTRTRSIGAALIFERLWQETGIGAVLHDMLRERRQCRGLTVASWLGLPVREARRQRPLGNLPITPLIAVELAGNNIGVKAPA